MSVALHAHIESRSADCDGSYSNDYAVFYNDDEIAESQQEFNDFSEINFKNRVLLMVCSPYATMHTTVKMDQAGIEVNEDTEEGYRSSEVRWCALNCDDAKVYFRDHRAESMGY